MSVKLILLTNVGAAYTVKGAVYGSINYTLVLIVIVSNIMTRRYKGEKKGVVKMKPCNTITNMLLEAEEGGGHLFQCNTQRCGRVVMILIGYMEG